jgi:large subunit ribosomal protein L3
LIRVTLLRGGIEIMTGLIGEKIGMTQIFDDEGRAIPVTVVKAGPCPVVQIKTAEKDGYTSIQIGYREKKAKSVNKPMKGHFARASVTPVRVLSEFRIENPDEFSVGQELTVSQFQPGDRVKVAGKSKGRGFTGSIKRHGFSGGDDTHGCRSHRVPGSLGASADPSRVFKGRKLPGRMGGKRITALNLEIVRIDEENNLLILKGAVPGPDSGIVKVWKV